MMRLLKMGLLLSFFLVTLSTGFASPRIPLRGSSGHWSRSGPPHATRFMYFLRICEWSKYQHYKDRNPPWIKLHRELLTSRTWVELDDASRVLAIASMMVAAITDNKIPASADYIRRVAYLNQDPDWKKLISVQFVELIDYNGVLIKDASVLLASCKQTVQNARPETETETEKRKKELKPSTREKSPRGVDKTFSALAETRHTRIQGMVMTAYQEKNGVECPWNGAEGKQLKSLLTKTPNWQDSQIAQCLDHYYESEGTTPSDCPHTYLDKLPKYLAGPLDKFGKLIGGNVNGNGRKADRDMQETFATIREVSARMARETHDGNGRGLPSGEVEPRDRRALPARVGDDVD